MNATKTLLTGAGLGACAAFLLDRESGRRRRARLVDQANHVVHKTAKAASKISRDAANRSEGLRAFWDSWLRYEKVSDSRIEERVRARIGRLASHPGSIDVAVEGGCVRLSGPILADEVARLLASVESVRGVLRVESALDIHEEAGDEPGLQGAPAAKPAEIEFLQEHWSPVARVAAGAAGTGLVAFGLARRGPIGTFSGFGGLGLLARALANVPLKRLLGLGAGPHAVDIQKTIEIEAPVEQVFDLFSNNEDLRYFMPHVRFIRTRNGAHSRWSVAGPLGLPVTWDIHVTERVPEERLAWRTLPGSIVQHAGVARFEPTDRGGTRLDIKMDYNPGLGMVGHLAASLLGVDAKHILDEDLVRFKSLLEQGKTTAHGETVTLDELAQIVPSPS
jgi:uncharacterized membrane protein